MQDLSSREACVKPADGLINCKEVIARVRRVRERNPREKWRKKKDQRTKELKEHSRNVQVKEVFKSKKKTDL